MMVSNRKYPFPGVHFKCHVGYPPRRTSRIPAAGAMGGFEVGDPDGAEGLEDGDACNEVENLSLEKQSKSAKG